MSIAGAENRNILISTDPFDVQSAALRIEFNPRYYNTNAVQNIWLFLQQNLLMEGFDFFLESAWVTRIDLATDVCPLSPQSLMVFATRLHRGDIRTGRRGEIQSFSLGSNHSDISFCIYDRDPEDNSLISTAPYTTRIEARMRRPCYLRDLHSLENPFTRLHVYETVDAMRMRNYPVNKKLFLDSVSLRGLQGAIGLLDRYETRQNYIAWLDEESETEWFDTDAIWQGYTAAVDALCLPISRPINRRRRRRRRQ